MKRILVTGHRGFLGTALVERLRREKHNVVTLDQSSGDVGSAATFDTLPDVDVVYHLAARNFVPESWKHGKDFVHTNVIGTQNVLDYCVGCGARLVFASAYVYGIPAYLPIDEKHPVNPNNPYALSKHLAEQLCSFYAEYRRVEVSVLRIFNIYGPGQKSVFLIPTIIGQVIAGEDIRVQDLTPRRDFVFLDDVVDAFIRAGKMRSRFSLINIGSGRSYSVAELIAMIQLAAGTALTVTDENHRRKQEIPDIVADNTYASEILGWQPRQSLKEGLKVLLAAASKDHS